MYQHAWSLLSVGKAGQFGYTSLVEVSANGKIVKRLTSGEKGLKGYKFKARFINIRQRQIFS